jgi:hypothetical protein
MRNFLALFLLLLPLGSVAAPVEQWKVKTKICNGQDRTSSVNEFLTLKVVKFDVLNLFYMDLTTIVLDEFDRQCHRIYSHIPSDVMRGQDVPAEIEDEFSLGRIYLVCWMKKNGKLEETPYKKESHLVRGAWFALKYEQLSPEHATFDFESSALCNGQKTHLDLLR